MTVWDFLSHMIDKLTGPKFGNVVLFWFLLILVILIMIEMSRLPWKPLSQFARFIGRAINADVLEDQKKIHMQLDELNARVEANHKETEDKRLEDKAFESRRNILIFAGEVGRGIRHSEEEFNQSLEDVHYYETYCTDHPKFPNERAVASIKLIRDSYEKCIQNHDFE